MRILMLGNSLTSANNLPRKLAELTGGEVVSHTRGGARLSDQLNPNTRLGNQTQAALQNEQWDYVVLQEMSHGPMTPPKASFPAWNSSASRAGRAERPRFSMPLGPTRKAGKN